MLNLNQLKNLYANSPLWIKKIYASIPYDLRNGKEYRKWKEFLDKNIDEESYKLMKVRETIQYAYLNTKFYKNLYDNLDISPYDIKALKDFYKLPMIDKNIVRQNFDDFKVDTYPKKDTFYVTTGGSSGDPMKFLQSSNVWKKEVAFGMKYFSTYGYKPSMQRASFRGGDFDDLDSKQFWKYNPMYNELHFSPFHINQKTIYSYVDDLNKFKLQYMLGYPSSFLLLMEHMKEASLQFTYDVKAIFLISENFTNSEIEEIKTFFQCKVSSVYGHSERLIFAPSNDQALSTYKIDNRYGFSELINDKNETILENNVKGELVGTSFDNLAMPLIRYKTGDYTEYVDFKNNIISLIDGRWTKEYLIGYDGFKLYLTALNMHSDIFKNVIKFQYHQDKIAKVVLYVVVNKLFTDEDENEIITALTQKAGHSIDFDIKVVSQLEFTSRGKLNKVIRTI